MVVVNISDIRITRITASDKVVHICIYRCKYMHICTFVHVYGTMLISIHNPAERSSKSILFVCNSESSLCFFQRSRAWVIRYKREGGSEGAFRGRGSLGFWQSET